MEKPKLTFSYHLASWLPVIVWASCIFYVSSYPTARITSTAQQEFILKKFAHIIEYSILSLLVYRALRRGGMDWRNAGIFAILFVFVYGMSDEFHERFVLGRESRFRDVVIDTIGASLAITTTWKLLPKAPQKLKSWAKKLELL